MTLYMSLFGLNTFVYFYMRHFFGVKYVMMILFHGLNPHYDTDRPKRHCRVGLRVVVAVVVVAAIQDAEQDADLDKQRLQISS